jgi:hypothetical protein
LPVGSPFKVFAGPEVTLKRNCISQLVISLSTLASIALLLTQVLPTVLAAAIGEVRKALLGARAAGRLVLGSRTAKSSRAGLFVQ